MKKRVVSTLGLLLAAVMSLGACAPAADSGETTGTDAGRDSVIVATTTEPRTVDPALANDLFTHTVAGQFYDSLMRLEQTGELVYSLAESHEVSEDGLTYTFKLRPDVKFHNGEIMTADDVVFSYTRAISETTTSRITSSIEKAEKVDDMTVAVTLKYPYGPFINCAAHANLGIMSKKAFDENGEEYFNRNVCGTGPYTITDWLNGEKVVLTRFEDYWRGAAPIKTAEFRVIADISTTTIALENGDIDYATVAASEKATVLANDTLFYDETPAASYYAVYFNMQEGMFTDPLLREAVSYCIDRESLVLGALEGNGVELTVPITPESFGYPEGFEANPFDPEKSKQLIEQAGYTVPLPITIRTSNTGTYVKSAEIIQAQLTAGGFDVTLDTMEFATFLEQCYTNGEYEIIVNSISALVPDADLITYNRFHSTFMGGGQNFTYTNNPEVDRLLDLGRMSQDEAERKQAYLDFCTLNKQENMVIPFLVNMNGVGCNENLQGVHALPTSRYYIYDWSWK